MAVITTRHSRASVLSPVRPVSARQQREARSLPELSRIAHQHRARLTNLAETARQGAQLVAARARYAAASQATSRLRSLADARATIARLAQEQRGPMRRVPKGCTAPTTASEVIQADIERSRQLAGASGHNRERVQRMHIRAQPCRSGADSGRADGAGLPRAGAPWRPSIPVLPPIA